MSQLTVPWREPIVDQSGNLSSSWLIFYNELISRVGGIGNVTDLSDVIASLATAQAQIDDQSVRQMDLGAQDAVRRIAELETLIPAPANLSDIIARLSAIEGWILDVRPPPSVVLEQWNAPTLLNSWANQGGGWNPAGYWKDPHGVVHLRGNIKSGTVGAAAFTLPAGYRPTNTEGFTAVANGAFGAVNVDNGGNVIPAVGSNVGISLDGITFRAA